MISLALRYGLPLLKFVGIPALIGIAYLWVNNAAYDRGHAQGWADNTAAQKKAIAIKKRAAEENRAERDRMTPAEADAELIKRCKAACGEDKLCVAACE